MHLESPVQVAAFETVQDFVDVDLLAVLEMPQNALAVVEHHFIPVLPLIRSFLKEIGSGLYQERMKSSLLELGRQLNIIDGANERIVPRNVGLLFFCEAPERFMPGTQIDVVIFPEGAGGDQIIEKILRGPIHQQIRDALRYIQNNVVVEKVIKHPDRAEATRFFNYPMTAIEETLVNAMYHRGYDQREPIEVRVNPGSIQIVSYPGPDPSIRPIDLQKQMFVSRRYRNRRIGEFFKELDMTEGRGTGVPKIRAAMKRNGSPRPRFETDENRLWFVAELPIHKAFTRPVSPPEEREVTAQVTAQVAAMLKTAKSPCTRDELQAAAGIAHREHFRKQYLLPLLEAGLIEMTIPEKPRSSLQRYRTTAVGRAALGARKGKS